MVVKTDAPYAGGLAAFGKPAAGVYALVHGLLNNRATVEGSVPNILADIPLLNPEAEVPEASPLLPLIASALDYVVTMNEQLQDGSAGEADQDGCESGSGVLLTVFHGQRAPPISILDYLVRMAKYTKCSPACFVHALVHMMRLAEGGPGYRPTSLNVHRLLLTSVLLSAKFLDDRYFNNAFYAKVGGVSTQELNRLEVEMLGLLEFRLLVTPEQVVQMLAALQLGQLGTMLLAAGGVALAPALPACGLLGMNDVLGMAGAPGQATSASSVAMGGTPAGLSAFGSAPAGGGGWVGAVAMDIIPSSTTGAAPASAAVDIASGGAGSVSQRKRRSTNSLEVYEPDCRPRSLGARRSMEMVSTLV